MPKIDLICPVCKKEFTRWPCEIKKDGRNYCCQKCHHIDQIGSWTGEKNPLWRGGKITKRCSWCGNSFMIRRDIDNYSKGIFCSKKCFDESRLIRTKYVCKLCKKEFTRTPGEIRQHKTQFCSQMCWGKWNSIHNSGANSPLWKGGKGKTPSTSKEKQAEYAHRRWARKKNAPINDFVKGQWEWLLEYFNYRCAYCLKPLEGKACVEHMIPLSRGGDNTLSNIVPSCKSCNSKKNNRTLLELVARSA